MASAARGILMLVAAVTCLGSSQLHAQNSGDMEILHFLCGDPGDTPLFSREQVLSKVAQMYGQDKADELDDLTDPQTGTVGFVELSSSRFPGASDKSTIAINTSRYPLWLCANAMVHEGTHCTRPRPPGSDGPDSTDPETSNSNPCGTCNHAAMLAEELAHDRDLCFESPEIFSDPGESPCELFCQMIDGINTLLDECAASSCGSVPNVDTTPPCGCVCN